MPFVSLRNRDMLVTALFVLLTIGLWHLPTGFENRVDATAVRSRAEVLGVDNDLVKQFGILKAGVQQVRLRIEDGPFAGQEVDADNPLLGKMELDKLFSPGDEALAVITVDQDGQLSRVNPQDHYRLGWELALFGLFALLLAVYGGWTGMKALLSFVFAGMVVWKILVPGMLRGLDPLWLSLGVVTLLCAAIIFLVAGPTRRGLVAFLGAFLGVLTSCVLAVVFAGLFRVNGAVLPFSETLLYTGYAHLDLVRIYIGAVFLAASGAVMDLAMDVASAQWEVVCHHPGVGFTGALRSGFTVGRAVVGTMTTTLLLAYSGGFITLLMAFMAQGVPVANLFNLVYVAAEVLKTLVGSFGLVMVAPFTAVVGAFLFTRRSMHDAAQQIEPDAEPATSHQSAA